MNRRIRLNIYLFNFLFLFYTAIGPAKAVYHYVWAPSDTDTLIELRHLVQVRFDKKYVQYNKGNVQSSAESDSKKFNNDVNFHFYYPEVKKLIPVFLSRGIVNLRFYFSEISFPILHCNLRL